MRETIQNLVPEKRGFCFIIFWHCRNTARETAISLVLAASKALNIKPETNFQRKLLIIFVKGVFNAMLRPLLMCYLTLYSMNIFVAKLNFKTRKEELEAAFAQYGQVISAKIVRDKDTGRSKGYGFVEMANDSEAHAAIAALNEKELDGRVIVVKPANPKPAGND
ncbi:MAG: RNA recognition motif domain-containing protein [Bacteroidota bacterium]